MRTPPRPLLEPLEPRTLLNGLTVITHGWEPLSTARPNWLDAMASAIVARTSPSTAVYTLRIERNAANNPIITGFSRLSGPAPTSPLNTNNENILLVDYAAASDVLNNFIPTSSIAQLVTPILTTALPAFGITAPLAQGPIQLIGHSRGASLISEVAKDLGQQGIWVDQLTTLDPVPAFADPAVVLRSNTIFADNYYQSQDPIANGTPVAGALNFGPLSLPNGYNNSLFSFGLGTHHDNVHLYYQGTINLAANATDNNFAVDPTWYATNHTNRAFTGFYYSRLVGGVRPASAVGANFGGTAQRSSLTLSGPQWPNVGFLTPSTTRLSTGQNLAVRFKYQVTSPSAAGLQFFLDRDQNPFNNNSTPIGTALTVGPTGSLVISNTTNLAIPNIASAGYFLEARINNAAASRFAYTTTRITVTAPPNLPPRGFVDVLTSTTLKGWAYDPTTPTAPIVIGYSIDNKPAAWAAAKSLRNDLIPLTGSALHGFSLTLPRTVRGRHTLTLYGVDTTTHTLTKISVKPFFTA